MRKKDQPSIRPTRTKSLEELEGFVAGEPPYDSNLVRTLYALRKKPIGEFTTEDLRITLGQGRGIPHLLPLALERLEADPFAQGHMYRGDLLMNILHAEPHWSGLQGARARVRLIVQRALEQLARVEPVDWAAGELPDPDRLDENDRRELEPKLRDALSKFL